MKLIRITTVPISLKVLLKGQLHFMSERGFDVIAVSSAGKELEEVEDNEKVKIASIEMVRTISPLKDLNSLWKFYKFCRKTKPDIVHSHTPKAGIVGMLGAKLAGVPIRLHTVAGLPLMETKGLKRIVLNFVEKFTYKCATSIYPNSRGLNDFILENEFTDKKKLKVIANGSSNGIDTNFFDIDCIPESSQISLRNLLGIDVGDFVFIFVGRIVGDKGVNELIRAFKKVVHTCSSNFKLLLVGAQEADLDPLLEETLLEIANNKCIVSVGFQKDVRPYFAISDALVFPSYREGFPNVVMQAGAMGLPCIVSDINGCNEIIIDGNNGLIVPVKSTSAIVDAMKKISNNIEFYNSLKVNSRKMITSRYEQRLVWNSILDEYKLNLKGRFN
jgi:glycosyltransferase involved in cell wall biosynthesis